MLSEQQDEQKQSRPSGLQVHVYLLPWKVNPLRHLTTLARREISRVPPVTLHETTSVVIAKVAWDENGSIMRDPLISAYCLHLLSRVGIANSASQ